MIIRLMEKLFCSPNFYEYQNLVARHHYLGIRARIVLWTTKGTNGEKLVHVGKADDLLDQMDKVWKKMNILERCLIHRWVKHGLL